MQAHGRCGYVKRQPPPPPPPPVNQSSSYSRLRYQLKDDAPVSKYPPIHYPHALANTPTNTHWRTHARTCCDHDKTVHDGLLDHVPVLVGDHLCELEARLLELVLAHGVRRLPRQEVVEVVLVAPVPVTRRRQDAALRLAHAHDVVAVLVAERAETCRR